MEFVTYNKLIKDKNMHEIYRKGIKTKTCLGWAKIRLAMKWED